ncbi:MAG TPA: hypothetical protein VFO54_07625 [Chryseosolibacter sp.]|nr:hypothetical protein [Chryseosolibacter sp.]
MTTSHNKLEILQSLNSLDAVQSEKVLDYIRGLLQHPQQDFHRHYFRRKAMKEIGQALREIRR